MQESRQTPTPGTAGEVFLAFLLLGLTSFGGPVAHIGYFREAFVVRRRWISEASYADLVALCQFLPGPASSQVGMAIGLQRAGYVGLLAAWAAFTLPSAVILVVFAWGVTVLDPGWGQGWIAGLKAGVVAIVAHAVMGMATSLTPDRERATLAILAMVIVMLMPTAGGQVVAILVCGLAGLAWLKPLISRSVPGDVQTTPVSKRMGAVFLACFGVLLALLPFLAITTQSPVVAMIDGFYRAGSLVFGGGHVVLPLLQAEVVAQGHVSEHAFLAGYGMAQAVPGPLFSFAAYLGSQYSAPPNGVQGATIALIAIYLPSMLLVVGALPFWEHLRASPATRNAMLGINAAVVGLLAAALYDPVFKTGVTSPQSMAIAAAAFLAISAWKLPAWLVVPATAVVGHIVL
ncbi:MAG: chromate efflux transporter [Rhizobiaceae bacterium]|nr:chromate efflux transporter [Rhizobiaceae bacterium]